MEKRYGLLRINDLEFSIIGDFFTGQARIINSNFKLLNMRKVEGEFNNLDIPYYEFAISCDGLPIHQLGFVGHCHLKPVQDTNCWKVVPD